MHAHDFMKKFLRRLKLFSQAKKVWRLPPRQDLLILDRVGSETIEFCLLGHSDYDIIDVRGESINIPVLLISLLAKKSPRVSKLIITSNLRIFLIMKRAKVLLILIRIGELSEG